MWLVKRFADNATVPTIRDGKAGKTSGKSEDLPQLFFFGISKTVVSGSSARRMERRTRSVLM